MQIRRSISVSPAGFQTRQNSVAPSFHDFASMPEIPWIPMSSPDPVDLPRPRYVELVISVENLAWDRPNNQMKSLITKRYSRKYVYPCIAVVYPANFMRLETGSGHPPVIEKNAGGFVGRSSETVNGSTDEVDELGSGGSPCSPDVPFFRIRNSYTRNIDRYTDSIVSTEGRRGEQKIYAIGKKRVTSLAKKREKEKNERQDKRRWRSYVIHAWEGTDAPFDRSILPQQCCRSHLSLFIF